MCSSASLDIASYKNNLPKAYVQTFAVVSVKKVCKKCRSIVRKLLDQFPHLNQLEAYLFSKGYCLVPALQVNVQFHAYEGGLKKNGFVGVTKKYLEEFKDTEIFVALDCC